MKIVKSTVKVSQEVVNGDITLSDYVASFAPNFYFLDVYAEPINSGNLLAIYRRLIPGDQMEICYIVNDDYTEYFVSWFNTMLQQFPEAHNTYIVPNTLQVISETDQTIHDTMISGLNYSTTILSGF